MLEAMWAVGRRQTGWYHPPRFELVMSSPCCTNERRLSLKACVPLVPLNESSCAALAVRS
jgi:hypothetical protein